LDAGQTGDRTPDDRVVLQGVQRGGRNRQWNFFAPVTVNMFGPGLERLRDVCFDPAPLARDLDLAWFTGREWLIESIDRFISEKPRGYVIVQAEAGIGKSTLAAHLVWSRPWLHHFTRLPGGRSPEAARKSLSAQLIARWGLDQEWAPAGALPAHAARPDWFGRLLEDAARKRDESEPGVPIVLVIDGMDEAEPDPASGYQGLPLGLPSSLPDRVFVVATSRFGIERSLHPVRRPHDWLEIAVDGPGNLDDMRRFLVGITDPERGDPRLTAALRRDGTDARWFRSAVADACGGVWIYLRYVLDEIRDGDASACDVTRLPTDLAGYYSEQVQRWRGTPDDEAAVARWEQVRLPLLGVLAAARAPLNSAELATFTGVPVAAVRVFVEETARAFLNRDTSSSGELCYAVRHQSLRDLFTGDVPANRPDLASLTPLLAAQVKLAHEQIAAALVPSGASSERDWGSSRAYARFHLAAHAAACGALDSLVCDPGFLLAADPTSILSHRGNLRTATGKRALAALDLTFGQWEPSADEEARLAQLGLNAARVRATELVAACADCSSTEWPVRWAAWTGHGHQTLAAHEGGVRSVAIGQAGGHGVIVSGGADATVRCWDAIDGTQLGPELVGHCDNVTSVAVGRAYGREVIVSGSLDGTVRAWDAVTHEPVWEPLRGHGGRVGAVAIGRAGTREVIVCGCAEGWVQVWDAATGHPVTVFLTGVEDLVESLAIGRGGDRDLIIVASADGSIQAWDATGDEDGQGGLRLKDGGDFAAPIVAIGPVEGRNVIISGSADGTVRVWDAATGYATQSQRNVQPYSYDTLTAIAIGRADDQDVIVCGYWRSLDEDFDHVVGVVQTWNAVTGKDVTTLLDGGGFPVTSVALGRAGGRDIVVAGSSDGTLRIWDAIPVDRTALRLLGHEDSVSAVAIGTVADRDVVASAARDGTVRIWDAATGAQVGNPRNPHYGTPVTSVAIGTVGGHDLIISGSEEGELAAREALIGISPWPTASMHQTEAIAGVTVGHADRHNVIISAAYDGYIQIWHPPFPEPIITISATVGCVTSVATGRAGDADIIVTGSQDGVVSVWSAATGDETRFSPIYHGSSVNAVAVGRASNRDVIVSCSDDGTVKVWDAITAEALLRLPASPRRSDGSWRPALLAVAIGRADDRDVIVTGCEDGIVRVWDAITGALTSAPLACHDDCVNGVAIGRAGNRTVIASCSVDRSVVVHEYRPTSWQMWLRRRSPSAVRRTTERARRSAEQPGRRAGSREAVRGGNPDLTGAGHCFPSAWPPAPRGDRAWPNRHRTAGDRSALWPPASLPCGFRRTPMRRRRAGLGRPCTRELGALRKRQQPLARLGPPRPYRGRCRAVSSPCWLVSL
jgi:WD40 repeat protein